MKKKKEEEQELVFGQRFDDYKSFKDKGIDSTTFKQEKPKPKTSRERFNDRFVKREGGGFVRRGTAPAQRAENREKNRNRAKQMAKARRNK